MSGIPVSALQRQQTGQSANLPSSWWVAGIVLPILIYVARAVRILADPLVPFDTLHTYLPLARIFLENPAAYFSLPASVAVAPGAVLYMALWGADPVTIKSANLVLGLISLVLVSDAARRIAGAAAGAAAAWAVALSPMLLSTGVTLMGEAPFVFLVFAWLWACTYATQDCDQSSARRNAAVAMAGICLAAATLTRGTWVYWIPVASVAGAVVALLASGQTRATWLRLAFVHVIAMLFVGAFMARQYEQFDRPIIATGSGGALYFGSNPMLRGYEPPFFGLAHDEFTVTDHLGHLSLTGDQRLAIVARVALNHTLPTTLAQMYVQKLGAFLFFSRAHLGRQLLNDRAMRIGLLVLALIAFTVVPRRPILWMLAGALAYQCAVHLPVMYNPRYSASALDPVLTLLAATGFGFLTLLAQPMRWRALVSVAAVVVAGIGFGIWHQRTSAPPMPDIAAGPNRLLQAAAPAEITVNGSEGNPFEAPVTLPNGQLKITWQPSSLALSDITVVNLAVPYLTGQCSTLGLSYTDPAGLTRSTIVRLNGWRAPQDIAWGMFPIRLPDQRGSLGLRFDCEPGTVMGLGRLGLFEVSIGRFYREQALGSKLAKPFVVKGN